MLKSIAKRYLRTDHRSFLGWYRSRFGGLAAFRVGLGLIFSPSSDVVQITGRREHGPIVIRPGTADQAVYDEVYVAREYAIDVGSPRLILDAGAHIGLASLYFAQRFPKALVVALEPESRNFALLEINTRQAGNVVPINAALWRDDSTLEIRDLSVDNWGFQVRERTAGAGVLAVDILSVLNKYSADRIDVLKIDIEGAELEVLGGAKDWIDRIGMLIIELHDRFRPGCSSALRDALAGFTYDEYVSGENLVITRIVRNSR